MCECYQIGGPFIAEDPDCPIHGSEAQLREKLREEKEKELLEKIKSATTVEEMRNTMVEFLGQDHWLFKN